MWLPYDSFLEPFYRRSNTKHIAPVSDVHHVKYAWLEIRQLTTDKSCYKYKNKFRPTCFMMKFPWKRRWWQHFNNLNISRSNLRNNWSEATEHNVFIVARDLY